MVSRVSVLDAARAAISGIPDPEIPVITIAELGILRELREADDGVVEVIITPTYNGCPAMHQIEDDIRAALHAQGISQHRIIVTHTPAWTSDWLSPAAKQKLRGYGIAPPHASYTKPILSTDIAELPIIIKAISRNPVLVSCPRCGSANTTETSHFGSTACKALYKCLDCLEPFDYFKPY